MVFFHSHSVEIIHLLGCDNHGAGRATAHGAALLEAKENELQDEDGLERGSVVSEGDIFACKEGLGALSTGRASDTVASDGGKDGTSEDRDASAGDAAHGAADGSDGNSWNEDAEEHESSQDEENEVEVCVVLVDDGPARDVRSAVSTAQCSGNWGFSAIVVPVGDSSVGGSRVSSGESGWLGNVGELINQAIGQISHHITDVRSQVRNQGGLVSLVVARSISGQAHVGIHDTELDSHGKDEAAGGDDLALLSEFLRVH